MDILPAIDLRDGKVVRLVKGDYDRQTTYCDDPAATAGAFVQAGAAWIHMVDLDAALTGRRTNTDAIRRVLAAVKAHVELGGGARDDASVEAMLALGVSRVVVGSAAVKNWPWFERLMQRPDMAHRVALGLDTRHGRVATHGWTQDSDLTAVDLARRVKGWPLAAIIYTDISRDGMLSGINGSATAEVIAATDVPVIASGGVASLDDVRLSKKIGCGGVIIGKAYYEGRINLADAIALTKEK